MASEVSICNEALDILGAERITSLTEDSVNAREMNACYAELRDRELEKHRWSFAVKRAILAPDATAPAFDYDYAFSWPTDCLRVLPPNRTNLDWQMENKKILTNEGDTLNLVYVRQVTDPNAMVPTFRGALAAAMAWLKCEKITQSNTKKEAASDYYRFQIAEARRTNAIQRVSVDGPEDTWVTARITGEGARPDLTWGG